jgi:diguanylate cyclase (GGDEF)-like protein
MIFSSFIKNVPKAVLFLLYLALTLCLWIIDSRTEPDLSFIVFYLVPILTATWLSGRTVGGLIAVICAAVCFFSDAMSHTVYSHPLIPFWNVTMKLAVFLLVVDILTRLKTSLVKVKELTRTDDLTGAANRRSFFESAQVEIDRMHRYKRAFSLAYIDLDDFKRINDVLGNEIGDRILRVVCGIILKNIRSSDIFARIAGDEFVLLLLETGAEQAQIVVEKLQEKLQDKMRKGRWPVSFSIGVMTYIRSPASAEELVKKADNLMCAAKREGKNQIKYAVWKESASAV